MKPVLVLLSLSLLPAAVSGCGSCSGEAPETDQAKAAKAKTQRAKIPPPGAAAAKKPGPPKLEPGFASPAEGVVVRAPWIPVLVHLGQQWEGASATVTLDGAPFEDATAVLRPRGKLKGGGVDYIATLYSEGLSDGNHTLSATFRKEGEEDKTFERTFEVQARAHTVNISVKDEGGKGLPARIRFFDKEGRRYAVGRRSEETDPTGRDSILHTLHATDGKTHLRLDPGTYRVLAYAGLRHEAVAQEVEVDGDEEVTFTLKRVLDLPETLVDFSVHTAASSDSWVPVAIRRSDLSVSGLDAAVVTDNEVLTDLKAWPGAPLLVRGVEVEWKGEKGEKGDKGEGAGHLVVWPIRADATFAAPPEDADIGAQLAHWRALGTDGAVVHVAHPRGVFLALDQKAIGTHDAMWENVKYDGSKPVTDPANAWLTQGSTNGLSVDAIDVANRWNFDGYRRVRKDWLNLWSEGYGRTAVATADSHSLNLEQLGFPVNIVDAPADPAKLAAAVRAGKTSISTGPVLHLTVEANKTGKPGDLVSGKKAKAKLRVQAASWVPLNEVRLLVNGEVAQTSKVEEKEGSPIDQSFSWDLEFDADAYVVAEAGYPLNAEPKLPELYRDIAPGYTPYALTNPVRVDADGDGEWTAPGRDFSKTEAEHTRGKAPASKEPGSKAPVSKVPASKAPASKAPATRPKTKSP